MATKKKKASRSKKAIVRLDSAFYPKAALVAAREAFKKLATIEIKRQGQKQVVTFSGMSSAMAGKLPDEFVNYALSCTVSAP
jgi:hypothetical protein